MTINAIVLAAGKGTRMFSDRAKVLHEAAGLPLVGWMHRIAVDAGADQVVVVVGHQADRVRAALPEGTATALQAEQLGTGHATAVALEQLEPCDVVVVLPGDMPLIRPETITSMITAHTEAGAAATMLTVDAADPSGYGRVVRGSTGAVTAIVEHGDATDEELAITEINTSVYAFDPDLLGSALEKLGDHNVQGERYLTDVVGVLVGEGHVVATAPADRRRGIRGQLPRSARRRVRRAASPDQRRLDGFGGVHGGPRPGVDRGRGGVEPRCPAVGRRAPRRADDGGFGRGAGAVGAHRRLDHRRGSTGLVRRGAGCVHRSPRRGGAVRQPARGAPSSRTPPRRAPSSRSRRRWSGPGSKVPHLSYVGDATIGADSNVGAGTITANYDGYRKHRTVIGDGVRIGSDTVLVAPVEVGDGAWTGAGSVITSDVAPDALAVTRSPQREVPNYAQRRKARAEDETT